MTQVLTCLFLSMGLLGANETAVEKAAQAVIAAHKHDNPFLVQQRLSQSIVQFKPNQISRLDEQLQKAGLPTAANLLGQLRLKFVQQNFADALPVPKGRERLLLLKYLQGHVEDFTKKTRQRGREIKGGKLAETLDEFEDQLWDLHVLRNELLTAERIAAYAKSLASDKAGNALGLLGADDKA
ncbi:MAG: hypothetical protein JWM11_3750, partial [Planctomycetaceae bacterium]|nr:hypothetical protein [Planctomycetaceae bacterium]